MSEDSSEHGSKVQHRSYVMLSNTTNYTVTRASHTPAGLDRNILAGKYSRNQRFQNVGPLLARVSTTWDCTNPCRSQHQTDNWDWLVREGNDFASKLPHPDNHWLHE